MDVDRLRQLQGGLDGPMMDDDALRERLTCNYRWLESMARAWQQLAAEHDPGLARFVTPDRASRADMLPDGTVTQRVDVDLEPLTLTPLARLN
jgi:hypothetical protein